MGERAVARRYAKAFLGTAVENNSVDQLLSDVEKVWTVASSGNGELFAALKNPVFKVDERKAVLEQVLQRIGVHAMTRNLLLLLLEKGRFADLAAIAESYRDMADERAGRVKVIVETAVPIGGRFEQDVRASLERVTGKQVVLESRVDPSLLGGMVARVGSKVYDGSVRTRLEDIRQRLNRAQTPAEA